MVLWDMMQCKLEIGANILDKCPVSILKLEKVI